MSINRVLNYLLAGQSEILLGFSGQVTTSSTYLKGPGGEAGDGFPLPGAARIYRIDCWDGVLLSSALGKVSASAGDRLSVYANINSGNFDVYVRINGGNSTLVATGVSANSTLMVTVHLKLI